MSLLLALFGHGAMSDVSPFSGEERKLDFGTVRSEFDPKAARLTERPHAAKTRRLLPAASYDTI